ncbi:MAG: peptidylprolyl isomerase [archaeon]
MKQKTMVLVEFTGREEESGKVFDTTDENAARQNGIYRENAVFRPIPVIVGNGDLLKGLDDAILEMNEGEKRTIALGPEKAFGERRKELVVVIPLHEFARRKLRPFPGLIVDLNGAYGRVQTVSGGRVRVDMNNDLAGKTVVYELKILKEVKDVKEKAELLTEKFFPLREKAEVKLEKGILNVKFPKEIAKQLGPLVVPFTKTITESIPEIKSVEFADLAEKFGSEKAGTSPAEQGKSHPLHPLGRTDETVEEQEHIHEHVHDHEHHVHEVPAEKPVQKTAPKTADAKPLESRKKAPSVKSESTDIYRPGTAFKKKEAPKPFSKNA